MSASSQGSYKGWRVSIWSSGGLINAIELGISVSYLLYFLTQVLLVPAAIAGAILFASRIWDVFTDPVMGWIADRFRHRIRTKTFVLIGALCVAAVFPLKFLIPADLDLGLKVALFILAFILDNTAATVFAIPHLSLVNVVAPIEKRSQTMGWYLTCLRVGLVMVGLGAPLAFSLFETQQQAFIALGFGCSVIIAAAGVAIFRAVDESPAPGKRASPTPWHSLKGALMSGPLRNLAALQVVKNSAVGCSASVLAYFITMNLLGAIELVGILGIASGMLASVWTPMWTSLSGRVDIRRIATIGILITAGCLFALTFLGPGTAEPVMVMGYAMTTALALYMAILFVQSAGDAAINFVPSAMVPDANEWRRRETGLDDSSSSFALFSLTGKLGFATGGFLASLILSLTGFQAGLSEQTGLALLGIRLAVGGIPALLLLLCLPIVWSFPHRRVLLAT